MSRIIESVPSKNVEHFKRWLAHLNCERIDELLDSSIVEQRAINLYIEKSYDEAWFSNRIKTLLDREI